MPSLVRREQRNRHALQEEALTIFREIAQKRKLGRHIIRMSPDHEIHGFSGKTNFFQCLGERARIFQVFFFRVGFGAYPLIDLEIIFNLGSFRAHADI